MEQDQKDQAAVIRQECISLVVQGASVNDVAREYGISPVTLYRWMAREGIIASAKQRRDTAVINHYSNTDTHVVDICLEHGISPVTLYAILRRHGVTLRSKDTDTKIARENRILEMFDAGVNMDVIREEVGMAFTTIYSILRKHGRPARRG